MSKIDDFMAPHIANYHNRVRQILSEIPAPPGTWTRVTVPCISIRHLRRVTLDWLKSEEGRGVISASHDSGVFLVAPGNDNRYWLPFDLRDVCDAADSQATHGWFMLDVDGDEVPGLPLYKD